MFASDAHSLPPGQVSREVFLSRYIQTTACLQVDEKAYSGDRWWVESKDEPKSPEHAFEALIWALHHKDLDALRKVTDAKDAGDERFSINGKKGFEAGAELMFEQFESLKIVSV